ncbi:MAG TPA: hypothetical protein VK889_08565 [Solirubrobacterales bacterium]|nr:hypothetical protein [Solirubrobacterales bacterium]
MRNFSDNASPEPRARVGGLFASHPGTTAFLVAFLVFLATALVQGDKFFYYDAGVYWYLSGTFMDGGHFSFLNFENNGLRGYALPLVYYLFRKPTELFTVDPYLTMMIFNAGLFALIGGVLAPKLASVSWPETAWGVPRRLLLCALILVFWAGYLSYPLSDFPSLAAALLAIVAVSASNSPLSMLAGGVAAGVALNMRPAYILLIPLLLAAVAWEWEWYRRRGIDRVSSWRRALCLVLFLLGALLTCLPQSLSQHQQFGSYSPIPGGSDLAGIQYTGGLEIQLYGTYVGNGLDTPRMEYRDPAGEEILAELPGETVSGTGEYAKVMLEHPLVMSGVFLRHLVNGLDQRYNTPLVEDLEYAGQDLLRFGGFLLFFLALLRIAWPRARRGLGLANWRYPGILALACATSLPSGIEARFLLPVFVLSCLLVLAPGWPSPVGPAREGAQRYALPVLILLWAVAYFALVWVIVSGASENLRIV